MAHPFINGKILAGTINSHLIYISFLSVEFPFSICFTLEANMCGHTV